MPWCFVIESWGVTTRGKGRLWSPWWVISLVRSSGSRVPTSKAQSAGAAWLSVSHFRWKRGNTMKSVPLLKQTNKQTNKIAMNPRLGKWISSVWNMTFQPQNLSTSLSLSLSLFLSLNTHSYTFLNSQLLPNYNDH